MREYARKRKRTRAWPPEVLRAFSELVGGVHQPSIREVRRDLIERFGEGDVPSERTLFDMRDEIRDESGGPWRLEDALPAEVWPVLDTMLALRERFGREISLTKLQARLIANIRTANPSAGGVGAWSDASYYITRRGREDWALEETLKIALKARQARDTPEHRRYMEVLGAIKEQEEPDNG